MKEPRQPRKRARQACLSCNQRRVKCDVTERMPCRHCEAADVPCEIRESRRGKHPRPSRRSVAGSSIGHDGQLVPLQTTGAVHTADQVEASQALASLSRPGQQFEWSNNKAITEAELASRDEQRNEDDGAVFLGESTSIRYVPEETEASPMNGSLPESTRLRHSVPNAVKAESLIPQWEAERRKARINYLRSEGAFTVPAKPVLEALLGAYFRWFHPCFPIVDEKDVWMQQQQGTLSPLLLQAMLFIGVIHCDEDHLKELGLGVRHRAKYIYYNRAKDIYDADHEQKKLTVIQALFLLSFWRAGALLEKDARHWLGAAISLAQTKALHRSSHGANGKSEKLRKRVWWSIYIRERQCAAALGLPHRIRDEDCDIEPLDRIDFDNAFSSETFPGESEEWISFVIGMCGLARILGRVVHSGYLPRQHLNPVLISQLKDELIRWKQALPMKMQLDNDFGNRPGFHANMLHLAYNNILILLYRSAYIEDDKGNGEVDGAVALQAAARNSRIIEDMLSDGKLRHLQIHCITNLFNTLCIHALNLRRSEGTARAIAEHRAKLCLMGLQELQKTWEVTNWVLQLFFQYLDRSTAARLQISDENLQALSPERSKTNEQFRQVLQSKTTTPLDLNGMTYGYDGPPPVTTDTPWSWSTEEANQFLLSQIESESGANFGEGFGGMWSGDEGFSAYLPQFELG
ncbi:uncharacterized protein PV09_04979 [Verruconis gallopava]|uniref:Zn(2)-C6 fungal-type domain-containing protein n=1 Tax=Verruconis gallopava TaxID=253628 RepID=A0A0D1YSP6_9PEZI|nr:uncharacterized protein PV09_04979 [Verruconis gallopava]KIW03657.1 hypothetical protein PV09_04979 [Verruconis gallopava]